MNAVFSRFQRRRVGRLVVVAGIEDLPVLDTNLSNYLQNASTEEKICKMCIFSGLSNTSLYKN